MLVYIDDVGLALEVVLPDLVNLVPAIGSVIVPTFAGRSREENQYLQEYDRIGAPSFTQRLDDGTRPTGNVCPPMTPNFSLITDTAQRDALERPVQCSSDGLSKRCLAGTRRANKPGLLQYVTRGNK